ncbi:MAG: thioredoxin family protein [Acidobacteria bacterium]|nr:MAG: thioredoxin family protein [Acidobacteriota bacterium]
MVDTPSTMVPLGTLAPPFSLPDIEGKVVSLEDYKEAPAILIVFLCNHCPFVKHILPQFIELAGEYQRSGVGIVGISSNDVLNYPEDSPEKMAELSRALNFPFPYLFDESQQVAKTYGAACTPDFYLFDREARLVYRGQMDDSRPTNGRPVTGADLRAAMDAVLRGRAVSGDQRPSIGCNIKWKPGNEPGYFRN